MLRKYSERRVSPMSIPSRKACWGAAPDQAGSHASYRLSPVRAADVPPHPRQPAPACTGGQGTVPYEQNTQQPPGSGISTVTPFALVIPLAGVGRHGLGLDMAADWAGLRGLLGVFCVLCGFVVCFVGRCFCFVF